MLDSEKCTDYKTIMTCIYEKASKSSLSDEGIFILHLDVNSQPDAYIASAMSNNNIQVLSLGDLKTIKSIKTNTNDSITAVKFSKSHPEILFSSCKDGNICKWDLRDNCEKPSLKYESITEERCKPLNCFDLNTNETFIIAGTDLVEGDAYVLFWDCRSTKLLGGYWESHTDDITQVSFNPEQSNILVSGSTDGLINIFDVEQTNEDDSLLSTLNTESSISKLCWLRNKRLSCITNTEEIQIWDWMNVEKKITHDRNNIRECLKTTVELEYFIDSFDLESSENDALLLASGTHSGTCQIWNIGDDTNLWSVLEGGHTDTVRCLFRHKNVFVSGGEDGAICIWRPSTYTEMGHDLRKEQSALKGKLKQKLSKKPY